MITETPCVDLDGLAGDGHGAPVTAHLLIVLPGTTSEPAGNNLRRAIRAFLPRGGRGRGRLGGPRLEKALGPQVDPQPDGDPVGQRAGEERVQRGITRNAVEADPPPLEFLQALNGEPVSPGEPLALVLAAAEDLSGKYPAAGQEDMQVLPPDTGILGTASQVHRRAHLFDVIVGKKEQVLRPVLHSGHWGDD